MIIYTDYIPERHDGQTWGFLTLIRPSHKDNKGLHAHEAVHRKQFWRNPLFGLWYRFSADARLAYELEAYRAQLKIDPESALIFAKDLSEDYELKISYLRAWDLLTKQDRA